MLQVPINYFAVIVAAAANIVVGSLWYGPVFGKQWIAMMGFTQQQIEEAKKKGMSKSYILAFVGSLVTAFVMAELIVMVGPYLRLTGVVLGLKTGFLGWLGFVVPVMLGTVLWEGRAWKLWALNIGYYLVSLLVMGIILALWM